MFKSGTGTRGQGSDTCLGTREDARSLGRGDASCKTRESDISDVKRLTDAVK